MPIANPHVASHRGHVRIAVSMAESLRPYPRSVSDLKQNEADRLTQQRRELPDQPGVYLFRDASGRVIYVGKAKSVRKRVNSHFARPARAPAPPPPPPP